MAPDLDIEIDLDRGELVVHGSRAPRAVWINRPLHFERGTVPIGALLGALGVMALLGLALLFGSGAPPLVPPAAAGTVEQTLGTAPNGYFPGTFAPIQGEIEPLPPTF